MSHKPEILSKAKIWLSEIFDKNTQQEVQNLIDTNPKVLEESFYKNAEFGTGGMRGIMGAGPNRINRYTLGRNTQGISNYLKKSFPGEELKAAIAYDCRNNSQELAKVVADVFSANGIKVFLFEELRPTPELSFAVKHLNCHCGIVLTASHNPPEYNGYKVYWQDGGQLVPPQDSEIMQEIENLEYSEIKFEENSSLIEYIGKEVDEAFTQASVKNADFGLNRKNKENLKIVFTSLHGTSITIVPQVLENAGFTNVHIVEEQREPNGNFPTVKSPNPEEPEALKMALEIADKTNADIVIGTDPDCDRLGIAVRDDQNNMILLNGNQTMEIMTWFLLEESKKSNMLNKNSFVASTIVSTPMLKVMTQDYGAQYHEVLTGFKWIAKLIKDHPELNFVGGGEESFGFMVGDFVRDKDAVTATLLACEIASALKAEGKTIFDKLKELYVQYGFYKEELISLVKKGIDGEQQIKQMMIDLRENPLEEIVGEKIVLIEDYKSSFAHNLQDHTKTEISIPKSNVLIYYTESGTKIAARPSGTEPKIKFYISVTTELDSVENYHSVNEALDQKISGIKKELQLN